MAVANVDISVASRTLITQACHRILCYSGLLGSVTFLATRGTQLSTSGQDPVPYYPRAVADLFDGDSVIAALALTIQMVMGWAAGC